MKTPSKCVMNFNFVFLLRLMKDHQVCESAIGVSVRCCYTCNLFIDKLSPSRGGHQAKMVTTTHGKIYPWTPPPDTPNNVKAAILDNLLFHLTKVLDEESRQLSSERASDSVNSPSSSLTPLIIINPISEEAAFFQKQITALGRKSKRR